MADARLRLGREWVQFARKSMGLLSARAGAIALFVALTIWAALLELTPISSISSGVFAFFVALAVAYALPVIVNRRNWPIWPLFVWVVAERSRLYPASNRGEPEDELIDRVDDLIEASSGEPGTWGEIRRLAKGLQPSIRREHVLAMADLFETDDFDRGRFDAALAELPRDSERRYWRVRLAMTRAFAAFAEGDEYLPLLLDVCASEGPFALTGSARVRLWLSRFVVSAANLCIGALVGLVIALVLRA